MNLLKINTFKKEIAYNSPVSVAGKTFSKRIIYELEIITSDDKFFSELSLIEGFHPSSYAQALRLFEAPENFETWPSDIKFPIEVSLFNKSFGNNEKNSVFVNSYFDPSVNKELLESDLTYKIKIGRNSLKKDLAFLDNTKLVNLRLDANRSLTANEFDLYLEKLENYDYFEEPFENIESFKLYPNERFALDENIENSELRNLRSVVAFVLKPSLLGLDKTINLINLAKKMGKRVVISSAFEGEQGHLNLLSLAAYSDKYLGYREVHGLGTIGFLKSPLKSIGICVVENKIEVKF